MPSANRSTSSVETRRTSSRRTTGPKGEPTVPAARSTSSFLSSRRADESPRSAGLVSKRGRHGRREQKAGSQGRWARGRWGATRAAWRNARGPRLRGGRCLWPCAAASVRAGGSADRGRRRRNQLVPGRRVALRRAGGGARRGHPRPGRRGHRRPPEAGRRRRVVVVNYAEVVNRLPWDEPFQIAQAAADEATAKHGTSAS